MKNIFIATTALLALSTLNANPENQRRAPARPYLIHLPQNVDTTNLSIRFVLTGSFGGYGGFIQPIAGVRDYEINTSVEGKPAEALKAIIYCPGYQVEIIDAPSLADSLQRSAEVTLKPLATVLFSGKVLLPAQVNRRKVKIEVRYTPVWECEFFGLFDCLLASTRITSVDAMEDGMFTVALPDFARDPVVTLFKSRGQFSFRVLDKRSGEALFRLKPEGARNGFNGIQVAVGYSGEQVFTPEVEK